MRPKTVCSAAESVSVSMPAKMVKQPPSARWLGNTRGHHVVSNSLNAMKVPSGGSRWSYVTVRIHTGMHGGVVSGVASARSSASSAAPPTSSMHAGVTVKVAGVSARRRTAVVMKNFRSTEGETGVLSVQWARRQSIAAPHRSQPSRYS